MTRHTQAVEPEHRVLIVIGMVILAVVVIVPLIGAFL